MSTLQVRNVFLVEFADMVWPPREKKIQELSSRGLDSGLEKVIKFLPVLTELHMPIDVCIGIGKMLQLDERLLSPQMIVRIVR